MSKQHNPFSGHIATAVLFALALGHATYAVAATTPCAPALHAFETAVANAAGNPNAGPRAPQSRGAQLGRQPTAAEIEDAKNRARSAFSAALARAEQLNAAGDSSGCVEALNAAKSMYRLPPQSAAEY